MRPALVGDANLDEALAPVLRQNSGQADKSLISQLRSGDNPGSMITLLLHVLRLLPFPLRRLPPARGREPCPAAALAVYKRTTPDPSCADGSPLLDLAG